MAAPQRARHSRKLLRGLLEQTLPWLLLSALLPAGSFPPARPLGMLMGMAQLPNPCPGRSRTHADRWRTRGIQHCLVLEEKRRQTLREVWLTGQASKLVLKSPCLQAAPRQAVFSPEEKLCKKEPWPSPHCWQILWERALALWLGFHKEREVKMGRGRHRIRESQNSRKARRDSQRCRDQGSSARAHGLPSFFFLFQAAHHRCPAWGPQILPVWTNVTVFFQTSHLFACKVSFFMSPSWLIDHLKAKPWTMSLLWSKPCTDSSYYGMKSKLFSITFKTQAP